MKKFVWPFVAALAVGAVAPALAADLPVKAAPAVVAAPSPWDIAFGAAVMNDYVFRGITQSNHKPSVAAYFEPRYNINKDLQLYVGLSGESISFTNHAAAEIDFYGGARWTIGQFVLDGGFWYYYYPGGQCTNAAPLCPVTNLPPNGNTLKADVSFWEAYFKPTWNVNDQLAVGLNEFYTPSFLHSGAWGNYLSGTVKYTAPANMAIGPFGWYVSGEFGRQWLGTTDSFYGIPAGTAIATGGFTSGVYATGIPYPSYNTWNVGLGLTWKVFTLDLRYSGTDLNKGDCNAFTGDFTASGTANVTAINPSGLGSNWCGSTFIAKLSADLTLGSLK
jgi:uncharacterized protein (TIGR02001 family)